MALALLGLGLRVHQPIPPSVRLSRVPFHTATRQKLKRVGAGVLVWDWQSQVWQDPFQDSFAKVVCEFLLQDTSNRAVAFNRPSV